MTYYMDFALLWFATSRERIDQWSLNSNRQEVHENLVVLGIPHEATLPVSFLLIFVRREAFGDEAAAEEEREGALDAAKAVRVVVAMAASTRNSCQWRGEARSGDL